jgi:hypothetical protein
VRSGFYRAAVAAGAGAARPGWDCPGDFRPCAGVAGVTVAEYLTFMETMARAHIHLFIQ